MVPRSLSFAAAVVVVAPLLDIALPPPAAGQCVEELIRCGESRTGDLHGTGAGADCNHPTANFPYDSWRFAGARGQTVTAYLRNNSSEHGIELIAPDGAPVAESSFPDGGPNDSRLVFTLPESSARWRLWVEYLDGFPPAFHSGYELTLVCSDPAPPPLPCPPDHFSDGAVPGFCFRVQIHANELIYGAKEGRCHPGTLCVSGAVPGRPELYLRLPGPRPNGRFWPTLARLSASPIEVEILQPSTGESRSYLLEAIPPGTDELPGLQDRHGFPPPR